MLLDILNALIWAGIVGLLGFVLAGNGFLAIGFGAVWSGFLAIAAAVLAIVIAFWITRWIHRFFGMMTPGVWSHPDPEALRRAERIALSFTLVGVVTQFVPDLLTLLNIPIR